MIRCHYPECDKPIDPASRDTLRAVWGWEERGATRAGGSKGGSDVIARRPFERYAHKRCVERNRAGVNAGQTTLEDDDE